MRHTNRLLLSVLFLGVLLQGCEDDPILEPTDGDDTGGGSYGNLSAVAPANRSGSVPRNPTVF